MEAKSKPSLQWLCKRKEKKKRKEQTKRSPLLKIPHKLKFYGVFSILCDAIQILYCGAVEQSDQTL